MRELMIVVKDSEMNDICQTRRREVYADFPKIVCLCGSTRFLEAFAEANRKETVAGHIVLSVGWLKESDFDITLKEHDGKLGTLKRQLDDLHKRKIELADEILVLNVGGYVGDSTRSEIEYAYKINKPIRFLENPAFTSEGA